MWNGCKTVWRALAVISVMASGVCGCATVPQPPAANADLWAQYSRLMKPYYNLDQQGFKQVSCKVEVDMLSTEIATVKKQLSPLSNKLRLTDTLDEYSLILDGSGHLTFHDPAVKVDILIEEGIADPDKVKHGILQVTDGFNRQVKGVDAILAGLFNEYNATKPGEMTLIKIDETPSEKVITFKTGADTATMMIRGPIVHMEERTQGSALAQDLSYVRTDNDKLILDSVSQTVTQAMQRIELKMAIRYQSLDGIEFPSTIDRHSDVSVTNSQATSAMTIHLTQCQLQR